MILRLKPFELELASCTEIKVGAAAATLSCTVGGDVGVMSTSPAWVAKEGAKVMFSAMVPVCKKALETLGLRSSRWLSLQE